ncbi:MAG: Gfo/Idh/MocA family oxidoreductase [Candidatus Cloacimonadaceae bacterium]|nr:Gfo/Idh/MocA family oxidoreductase [Candidatus Cloacimonadaceae bacterium]
MKKIRFGVIGCGYQTTKNMAPAMAKCSSVNIHGFYDLDSGKAEEMAKKYGTRSYNHIEELLSDTEIDAIYIATPVSSHTELSLLAAGYDKHVLCEKPLALNDSEAQKVSALFKELNLVLLEGFMYQYHTQHQFVREMIAKGEIGVPIVFYAWLGFPPFPATDFRMIKEMGGGASLDAGCYVKHAAEMFFGRAPIDTNSVVADDESGLDIHGSVLMDFGMGQSAILSYGMDNSYKNSYSVWGTKGEITLCRAFSIPEYEIPICRVVNQGLVREYQLKPCNHFVVELDQFTQMIADKVY